MAQQLAGRTQVARLQAHQANEGTSKGITEPINTSGDENALSNNNHNSDHRSTRQYDTNLWVSEYSERERDKEVDCYEESLPMILRS